MDSGAQQDISAPNVDMDTGDAPDTGAPTSGTETAEDAGVGDKSAGTEKGKAPEVPEVRTDPAPASAGQAAPAAPEQRAPKTPTAEKTAVPAKSGTLKMKHIIKTGTPSAVTTLAPAKPAPSSSTMTLHFGKAAARPSFFQTLELEGRISLLTKSGKILGSLKEHCM
jgi:hypothetical protein